MSLADNIQSLIAGISDTGVRLEVARTINYLKSVYLSGKVPEEEIREALFEVCLTVINYKEPFLDPAERKKKAHQLADQILNSIKMESLHRRMQTKFRGFLFRT